jgi:hypothetical protein
MQRMPSSLSSSSMAQPRARTPSSTFRKVCGSVMVCGVRAEAVAHHALDHVGRLERRMG